MGQGRRDFLKRAALASGALGAGVAGASAWRSASRLKSEDVEAGAGWDKGSVAHLLPAARHDALLIKASFERPLPAPPRLTARAGAAERETEGERRDTAGECYSFRLTGLAAGENYELELRSADGSLLCDPWPLRTAPAPGAPVQSFRLLAFSAMGGADFLYSATLAPLHLHSSVRKRLLARALREEPDAAVAIGDHIVWDQRTRMGALMARSPLAWWNAGVLDRSSPLLGGDNERTLKHLARTQIPGPYGALMRSTPVYCLHNDRDFGEDHQRPGAAAMFPPDPFMQAFADTVHELYYPGFLEAPGLGGALGQGFDNASVGALRWGDLAELVAFDCRRRVRTGEGGGMAHPAVERWIAERMSVSPAAHMIAIPSAPMLWTAGALGEWYPDTIGEDGAPSTGQAKEDWSPSWFAQHQRLLAAYAGRMAQGGGALVLSGEIAAIGAGQILRSAEMDLSAHPLPTALAGTMGTGLLGFPSSLGGGLGAASAIEAEVWQEPIEENGFTILDFSPDRIDIRQYRWKPEDGLEAIDRMQPFAVHTVSRAGR